MAEETEKTNTEKEKQEGNVESQKGEKTQNIDNQRFSSNNTQQTDITQFSKDDLLNIPQVQQLLEDTRRQEKDKLYDTIESKNNKIKELQEEVAKLEKEVENREDENQTELELLMDKLEDMENTVNELEKENKEIQQKREQDKLEAYKEKRIREVRENGDDLITKLVGGNSKEEIDESIEQAKSEYEKISSEVEKEFEIKEQEYQEQKKQQQVNSVSGVTNPGTNSGEENTLEFTAEDIKNMSMSEYKKHREKIKQLARNGEL